MFESLARIGKDRSGGRSCLELMLDPIGSKYCLGVGLVFDDEGEYVRETIKHFSAEELRGVRYKKGSGANDYDPLALVLDSGKYYNVADKLGRCCNSWAEQELCSPERKVQLERIGRELRSKKDEWGIRLKSLADQYRTADRYVFFYLISLRGKEEVPFYATKEAEEYLTKSLRERYGTREKVRLIGKNAHCAICGILKEEVYGNFSEVKTFNLDTSNFISGGLCASKGTKNLPICPDCACYINHGKNYVKERLSGSMAGVSYFMLPQCSDAEFLGRLLDFLEPKDKPDGALSQTKLNEFVESENQILNTLADDYRNSTTLTLKMVFYHQSNAAWRVLAEIDEILPSRLQKVAECKALVDSFSFVSDETFMPLSVRDFKSLAGSSFGDAKSRVLKAYLKYIEAIFKEDARIHRQKLVTDLARQVIMAQKARDYPDHKAVKALIIHEFLRKLEVFEMPEDDLNATGVPEGNPFQKFFESRTGFFDQTEKRVAFLTGALVKHFCSAIQKKDDAYYKTIRGRKLERKDLAKIYGEDLRSKISQYEGDAQVRAHEELLSIYWANSTQAGWKKLSSEELTLCFAIGMALNWHILKTCGRKKNGEGE